MPISTVLMRILVPILLVCISLGDLLQAQAPQIQIIQDQAVMDFPGSVTFHLNVSAKAPIQLINLRYGANGRTCQPLIAHQNIKFSPDSNLDLSWRWKLENQDLYLPPGAQIWWQWLVHTADEASLQTERQTLTVEDPDHEWQSLDHDQIHLEWYQGDAAFGQTLLEIARQSRQRLVIETGLQTTQPIRLLIYPDRSAIRSATLHLPEWTGGVAFPEYNTVLAAIAPDQTGWAELVVPHEIAHLLIASRIFNCQGGSLPLWVIEGFSKYAEGPLNEDQQAILLQGLSRAELPGLSSLIDQFPYESGQASQAYLVSLAAVQYLLQVGGTQSFSRLLDRVQAGADFEQSLLELYGFRPAALDQAWQVELRYGEVPANRLPDPAGSIGSGPRPEPGQDSGPDFSLLPETDGEISPKVLLPGLLILAAGLVWFWRRGQRTSG